MEATLNITSSKTEVFNNLLLGTNTHRFSTTKDKDLTDKTKKLDLLANLKIFDTNNIKVAIDGLTSLNAARKSQTVKGFDMM